MSTRRVVDGVPVGPHPNVDRLRQVLNVGLNANLAGNKFPKAAARTGAPVPVGSDAEDEQQLKNVRDAYRQVQSVIDQMKGLMKGTTGDKKKLELLMKGTAEDKKKLELLKKKTAKVMDMLKNPGRSAKEIQAAVRELDHLQREIIHAFEAYQRGTLTSELDALIRQLSDDLGACDEQLADQNDQIRKLKNELRRLEYAFFLQQVGKWEIVLDKSDQSTLKIVADTLRQADPASPVAHEISRLFVPNADFTGTWTGRIEDVLRTLELTFASYNAQLSQLSDNQRTALKTLGTVSPFPKALNDYSLETREVSQLESTLYMPWSTIREAIKKLPRVLPPPDSEDSGDVQGTEQKLQSEKTKQTTALSLRGVFKTVSLYLLVFLLIYLLIQKVPELVGLNTAVANVQEGVAGAGAAVQRNAAVASDALARLKNASIPLVQFAQQGGNQLVVSVYGGMDKGVRMVINTARELLGHEQKIVKTVEAQVSEILGMLGVLFTMVSQLKSF